MDDSQIVELVRLAQQGDREAFGQLVTRFERPVFATVLRRLRNRSEALEVTQDVFMQVLRKLSQLREPERFVGWLHRIAARLAINRAVRKPREYHPEGDTMGNLRGSADNPLDKVLQSETADQLWSGIGSLREIDRQTIVAFYFEGRSLQEMSHDFDSPVGTIKRRLHVARNRLRDKLSELQMVG